MVGLNPTGRTCDTKKLYGFATTFNSQLGLPDTAAEERAWQRKTAGSRLARRCYFDRFHLTPAALNGPPQGDAANRGMDVFRNRASRSVAEILQAPPGPGRDKTIKQYVDARMLGMNGALYFGGRSGLEEIKDLYRREDHQQVIALLDERLKDPAFTLGEGTSDVTDFQLFATSPFEALPCSVVPEMGSKRPADATP